KQFQQHGITFVLEFFDRALTCLLQHAVDDRLLDLGGEVSDCPKIFPPRGECRPEVLQEMLNSPCAAAQMKQKIGAHHSPTQTRSPAHGDVGISNVQHTLLNEVHDLAIQSSLQTVRDMTHNLFLDVNRLFANGGVERKRTLHRFG